MLTRDRCGAWITLTFAAGSRRQPAPAKLDLVVDFQSRINMLG